MHVPQGPGARPAEAVQDIEKRIQWRASATIVFLFLMVSLLVVAALAIFAKPRTAHGLPDAPEAARARTLLYDHVRLLGPDLRFRSALTGEWDPRNGLPPEQHARLVEAERLLADVARGRPLDPRAHAALAHARLGLHELASAEFHYRVALELAPHFAEAHLGLGVALTQHARITEEPNLRKRRLLQAAGRFAAVPESDPLYDCALHNRAIVLLAAGRTEEAEALARLSIARDPEGVWASHLRSAFGWSS